MVKERPIFGVETSYQVINNAKVCAVCEIVNTQIHFIPYIKRDVSYKDLFSK